MRMWRAIEREKEIKNLSRKRKEALISEQNPGWYFYDLRGLE
jgi:predicted GIY-YIG superfamily endonuclease